MITTIEKINVNEQIDNEVLNIVVKHLSDKCAENEHTEFAEEISLSDDLIFHVVGHCSIENEGYTEAETGVYISVLTDVTVFIESIWITYQSDHVDCKIGNRTMLEIEIELSALLTEWLES